MAKESKKEKEISWVDVHNDALMVSLGIRYKNLEPRDPEVWTKTLKDKKLLRRLRRLHKHSLISKSPAPIKTINIPGKLIVWIEKNPKYEFIDKNGNKQIKTTFSFKCNQSDIANIISKFVSNNGKSLVTKYYWNGSTYVKDVLPFWF